MFEPLFLLFNGDSRHLIASDVDNYNVLFGICQPPKERKYNKSFNHVKQERKGPAKNTLYHAAL
jgi:hypothetical protein